MTKDVIRDEVRKQKRDMTLREIEEESSRILKWLYDSKEYLQADAIYTYVSYNQEVVTHGLIEKALADGKKVAVPKVQGKEMEFYYISSLDDLAVGYQKILEPVTKKLADPKLEKYPLMIQPGLAFDKQGNRIGYGGGFYDRYLAKYSQTFCKCALGFSFQLYEELETESFDISMDMVISPEGIYYAECLHSSAERMLEHGVFNRIR